MTPSGISRAVGSFSICVGIYALGWTVYMLQVIWAQHQVARYFAWTFLMSGASVAYGLAGLGFIAWGAHTFRHGLGSAWEDA